MGEQKCTTYTAGNKTIPTSLHAIYIYTLPNALMQTWTDAMCVMVNYHQQ